MFLVLAFSVPTMLYRAAKSLYSKTGGKKSAANNLPVGVLTIELDNVIILATLNIRNESAAYPT